MSIYDEKESYASSRAGGIGGTDCAAILGLSPWKSPIDVYAGKVDPQSQPELDKECLFWGSALEPIVRDRYANKFDCAVYAPSQLGGIFPRSRPWNDSTLVIGKEPWMLGAPDGWLDSSKTGLEVKCSSRRSQEWGPDDSDEVPANYLIQVAWYMAVCEAPAWDFAVLFSGNTLARFHVKRDPALEADMIETARAFWHDFVLKQVEPPIDETESYGRYLARRFSLNTGKVINASSGEVADAAIELREAQAAVKIAEGREQLAKNMLMAALADADAAVTPVGKVAWCRPAPRKTVDYKGVLAEVGVPSEVVERFTKESPVSPFVRGWWKK